MVDQRLGLFLFSFFYCFLGGLGLLEAKRLNVGSFQKTRLIVMADMGNEPDEVQQMMHLLLYANMVDLEGLIACSGKYLHENKKEVYRQTVHPELFHELIDGYEKVLPNLKLHTKGWPEPAYLRSITKAGTKKYGIAAVKPGASNEATQLIAASILKDDPRPIYIVGNAGTNTLAQALVDLDESRSDEVMAELCAKIIVFENGAQDNAGAWIMHKYPAIRWHRSNFQTYAYGGPRIRSSDRIPGPYTWEPYERTAKGQHDWAKKHIVNDHGALGALFPDRVIREHFHFIEGGGTIPWMGLVNHGLTDPMNLQWGGWSGRFSKVRHKNTYSRHGDIRKDEKRYGDFLMFEADSEVETWMDPVHKETFNASTVPVWRFRRAMFNDFQGRMDWCVKPYDQANHNPVAAIGDDLGEGIIRRTVKPGEKITLNAARSTDPDGDQLTFRWWVYPEAGTYEGDLAVTGADQQAASLLIPAGSDGKQIHVILEVQDRNSIVSLYDYRRVVLDVK